jgi:ribosome-associated translation inhibitor RaiA
MDQDILDAIKNYVDHRDLQLNEKFNSLTSVTITLDTQVTNNFLAVDVPTNYLDIQINTSDD